MPNAEAGTTPTAVPDRFPHAREQQLRDAKQRAPLPKRSERSDHEDILEGLEREYASAMAKLQAAHEREMLLSSRVGDLQNKLQARACHMSHWQTIRMSHWQTICVLLTMYRLPQKKRQR
jgi:hypothetical protein